MPLPKYLTTVTTVSKLFALWLYLFLPFAGFYLGVSYQSKINPQIITELTQSSTVTSTKKEIPYISPFPVVTDDWNTFSNSSLNISFKYPKDWNIESIDNNSVKLTKTILLNEGPPWDKQNYINRITVNKTVVGNSVTLDEWFEQTQGQDKSLYQTMLKSIQKINLGKSYGDGMEALSVEIPGAAGYHTKATVGVKNNVGYEITTWALHYNSGVEEAYQGIIGTFALIDPNLYPTLPTITTIPIVDKESKVCLQDAQMCPDGSYVSRTGPNCEFAPCQKMEP